MSNLLTSNRFVAVLAYATLTYVLIEYARDNRKRAREWLSEYVSSPRAVFARSQRERMMEREFGFNQGKIAASLEQIVALPKEDCGCPDE
jgi:hypothetical protein